ncbi:site-specific DNA-methyltransferase [Thiolapillus sp.]|uniref:site-specific DNA-methyltransferase n=2 Tax=Thiolapillus sp. TaxID=2017437 RepID=UPI003AF55B3C
MSETYKKLIKTLQALFEMDKADLDFGIYRIMNQKRDEISRFLENDLLAQVREAFTDFTDSSLAELKQELQAAIEQARKFGAPDPENTEAVREIRQKLASMVDITAVENEVFSHLHTFFSRYYDKGDFISQRRYKKDTYAIPYEGEEVKLYWANYDQYYIKSSEHLRNYAFVVKDGDKTVRIKLVEADTEKDNVKAESGKERRFVLDADNPLSVENGELHIHFHYKPAGKKKQTALNKEAIETIFQQEGFDDWLALLKTPAPTEKNQDRTLLEKHLNDYTARNTFDYFIHKDLGGFLRRELDFYIKNEVLFLDDIDDASFQVTETHLRKIRVLRSIAHKIIRMLAQLEDFQKKLWLKKKFVVETHYCMTLDRVPEALYGEIVDNTAQHEEWVKLGFTTEDTEITEEYLKENSVLVLDTRFFDAAFKDKLLASIENFDEQCDGLLVHSENFQALNLMQERYREQVKCVYIDPPYNTGGDGFAYKDRYQHSSWLAALTGRAKAAYSLLSTQKGCFFSCIDDGEQDKLRISLDIVFGEDNFVANVIWQKKYAPANDATWLSDDHDFLVLFAKDKLGWSPGRLPRDAKQNKAYSNPDNDPRGRWRADNYKCNKTADERPNLYYPIIHPKTGEEIWPNRNAVWRYTKEQHEKNMAENRVWWGKDGRNKVPAYKRFLSDVGDLVPRTIWKYDEVGHNQDGIRQLRALMPQTGFTSPKPVGLLERVVQVGKGDLVLDYFYFAGSGTTAHAVINLNREDGGKRKYILVEMGEYFDTVLKPRIQKVVYSRDWKDGKPKPDSDGNLNGIFHCFKYLRLESYEDTLNNLILKDRTEQQDDLLKANPALREDYMLGYWLDVETADSPSLLNIEQFEDPFNYRLHIATGSVGATKPTRVDLVETLNYLIGLTVKHIDTVRGFRVVTGTNPKDEFVLVIWRNLKEKDNAALEEFMEKQAYHPRDTEFDHIYVNCDHTLEDPHSKVKMIEIEFKRLMFDVRDV